MKYIFILIFLVFSVISQAQIDIINKSLTDSSINIFYIGVDNEIELKTAKSEPDYIIEIKKEGKILHKWGKIYVVWVHTLVDTCILSVYNKASKKVFERIYKTRTLAPPVATLAGVKDTIVSISAILANPYLKAIIPGCYYRFQYTIHKFDATFISGRDSIFTETYGNKLSLGQTAFIKKLVKGDYIYFNNIWGTTPDSRSTRLPSFRIRIE